jgi:hypothetical protein
MMMLAMAVIFIFNQIIGFSSCYEITYSRFAIYLHGKMGFLHLWSKTAAIGRLAKVLTVIVTQHGRL